MTSGPASSDGCARRSASTPSSAITTGGTTSRGVRDALARVQIPVLENNAVLLGEAGQRFWLAGLAISSPPLGRGRFRGEDDLPGTLAQVTRRRSGHPAGARARYFPAGARPRLAHARRPYPWRAGPPAVRVAVVRAVGLWRALRLRPHRRGRPAHDRVRRPRHQRRAAAARRSAGDRADRGLGELTLQRRNTAPRRRRFHDSSLGSSAGVECGPRLRTPCAD